LICFAYFSIVLDALDVGICWWDHSSIEISIFDNLRQHLTVVAEVNRARLLVPDRQGRDESVMVEFN